MATKTLPMDIITNLILSKLPTKTLCRFKCVSKEFLTLISSPKFINLYSLSSGKNGTLFVTGIDSTLYSFNLNSLQSTHVQFSLSGFFTPVPNATLEVIGSCNGLLCLVSLCTSNCYVQTLNQIVLLNPFTRDFKEIPFHYLPGKIGSLGLGFGFDDVNHDYKLVSVTECNQGGCVLYVVVYSFNENTWKFINHNISSRNFMEPKSWSVLINNHLLHWLFFNDNGIRIGCFDLRIDEWIEDVPLPEPCNDGNSFGYFGLIPVCLRKVEDGCLCFSDLRGSNIDLWIMKEYGVKESWFLHRVCIVSIPNNRVLIDPIALRNNEILLKQRSASNFIFVCNIGDKSIAKIKLDGIARFFQAYECKETLVTVPGSAQIETPMTLGFDEVSNLDEELSP